MKSQSHHGSPSHHHKRRFSESLHCPNDHRILKSPPSIGSGTVRRRRIIFAGVLFFWFIFIWTSKRKWTSQLIAIPSLRGTPSLLLIPSTTYGLVERPTARLVESWTRRSRRLIRFLVPPSLTGLRKMALKKSRSEALRNKYGNALTIER